MNAKDTTLNAVGYASVTSRNRAMEKRRFSSESRANSSRTALSRTSRWPHQSFTSAANQYENASETGAC
ncbi:MAG: hypothetical protein AAGB46_20315, partial [Verrucomicrobiota bacterium]